MTYKATYRTRSFTAHGKRHSSRTKPVPGVKYEKALAETGAGLIAGVDEVGVGAWAGPVGVGMVVLKPGTRMYKVRDSKMLDPARREWLADRVRSRCLCWSTGLSWPAEIDEVGLSEAMRRAAERAVDGLAVCPDVFLVDGQWNFVERKGELAQLDSKVKMIVRGDCESLSIAAASVVAKVARDQLMCNVSSMYPPYLFHANKGYPSPAHKWALAAFGPSPLHRRLFAPVQRLVDEGTPGRLLPAGLDLDPGAGPREYPSSR